MSGYKDFPPGWKHILVPTTSRAAARIGLAMYTPCRRRGELTQDVAWGAVGIAGPGVLPGRTVGWEPPEPRARWQRLLRKVRKTVGEFDDHVIYERREGRAGVLLVLIQNDAPLAFVKIRLEEDDAIANEAATLELLGTTDHPSFSAPQLMTSGTVEGWPYLVTSPLPAGRHRMLTDGPPPGLFDDVAAALGELPRPEETPDHWVPMHGDLTPWNLRTFGKGSWLIDWETAGFGPPHADEVLYRATATALGRPVESSGPADVAEAIAHWIDEIDERAANRTRDGLPPEDMDDAIIRALRRLGGSATVGSP